ncbi:MAG: CHAT domain-containing protein [Acidobacteriia bacterium]|nr:CHAT domain-containing protein [Terriglobia bacterium]
MSVDWTNQVIAMKSTEEVQAFVQGRRDKVDLPLVEALAEEVVRYSRKDVEATWNLACAAMSAAWLLPDRRAMALAERAMANAHQIRGNYKNSGESYDRAIHQFEEIGDEEELARTLSSAIGVLAYLSEYEKGLEFAARARKIFQKQQDEVRLARLEVNLGNLYHRLDRFEEAIECYDRALPTLEQTGDHEGIAGIKSNRATCLIVLNRYEDALLSYESARSFCQAHDMPLLVAQADYNIAYLYYLKGHYSRSLEMLSAAAVKFRELNNLQHLALCDLDQSEIYLELNLLRDATELSERAAAAFQQLGMRYERAKAITNSAIAQARLNNLFKALEIFEEARALFVTEGNEVWVAMVDLYKATIFYSSGRHFEAIELVQKALRHFESQRLWSKAIHAEVLLTKIYLALGEANSAEQAARSASLKLKQVNAPWSDYQCHYVLGLSQGALGDRAGAKASLVHAIDVLETMRANLVADELKITFLRDKLNVFERLIALCLDAEDGKGVQEAYTYVERAKSRALVDLLSSSVGQMRRAKASSGEIVDHLQHLREELNWFYSKVNLEESQGKAGNEFSLAKMRELIRQREDQLVKILRQLPAEDEEYASLHSVVSVPTELIQKSLSERQALLEFYMASGKVMAFLVTREGLHLFRDLADVNRVKHILDLLKYQFSKFNFGPEYVTAHLDFLKKSVDTHLSELYELLIRPLAPQLADRDLVIVPHDFLHYVPFHALKTGQEYLVDRFTISYSPSASVFKICTSKQASTQKEVLVLGVPDPQIPFVLDEVQSVQSIFPQARSFTAGEVTEDLLRQEGKHARLLHIASHAQYRSDNPMFSTIQLGSSWLSLFDIYSLELDADLITLSGCGTGISRIVDGDELVGLVRGFLYAGTRSMVASLWNAYDRATADLMGAFYKSVQSHNDLAASLRTAMLEVKQRYPHPYYWAPFVLMGKTTL